PRVQRDLVKAMQHGLNRWIVDADVATPGQRVALDMCFDFGVILTTLEPLTGYEGRRVPPLRPCIKRISPRRFFQDPIGGIDGPRYMGHMLVKDLDDLREAKNPDGSKKYEQHIVEQLAADAD